MLEGHTMGHFRSSYRFDYDFGVSGMRGSIRLVKRSPNDRIRPKDVVGKPQNIKKKQLTKSLKTAESPNHNKQNKSI